LGELQTKASLDKKKKKKVCETPVSKRKKKNHIWAWWHTPVSPAMEGSLEQEDCGLDRLQKKQSKKG
jgi:hypothetical protein